ncbi:hypothetical protein J1614_000624 [Plenodomus biglobosus]|nr:hypothetical protein J1614_000624 [Plenodomus biglobosus]
MQFTTFLPSYLLLVAAAVTQAAPSPHLTTRQTIPFNIALLSDNFCATRYSTSFPTTSPDCQILSQPAVGAFATTVLPAGCTSKYFPPRLVASSSDNSFFGGLPRPFLEILGG